MRVALLFTIAALHAQQPRNCPGFPNCLYTPASETEFVGQTIPITYDDVTGTERTFEAYVRVPNVRGKMPVVIWAHGGGEGKQGDQRGTGDHEEIKPKDDGSRNGRRRLGIGVSAQRQTDREVACPTRAANFGPCP